MCVQFLEFQKLMHIVCDARIQQRIEGKRIYCSSWKNLYEIPGRKDLWHESRGLVMGGYKEGKNWKVQVYYKDWQGNRKRKQKRGFRTKGEAKEWKRIFSYLSENSELPADCNLQLCHAVL